MPAGRLMLVVLLGLMAGAASAEERSCRVPDDLALKDLALPAVRSAATTRHALTILTIGGSSTAGVMAGGPAFTYPARLGEQLRARLPGVVVTIVNRGQPGGTTRARVDRLQADLAEVKADLVVWAPGSSEAGMSEDPDSFVGSLQEGLEKIRAAGTDVILIDLQYAPSIARVLNLGQYNAAIAGVAGAEDVPLLRRSELMRRWNDDGTFELDKTLPGARQATVRRLFDCVAAGVAEGVAAAVTAAP